MPFIDQKEGIEHFKAKSIGASRKASTRIIITIILLSLSLSTLYYLLTPDEATGKPMLIFFIVPILWAFQRSPYAHGVSYGLLHSDEFDEFELQAIQRAGAYSYFILLALIMLLCLIGWNSDIFGYRIDFSHYDWKALSIFVFGIASMLPVCIVEWIIPIPPKKENDNEL